jgi:hypothetical protein
MFFEIPICFYFNEIILNTGEAHKYLIGLENGDMVFTDRNSIPIEETKQKTINFHDIIYFN